MRRRSIVAVVGSVVATLALVAHAAPDTAVLAEMAVGDHRNLERNLRWMLERERAEPRRERPGAALRVGVLADAGVWYVSARSVVDALEAAGVRCVVLDRSRVTKETLATLDGVVVPGGWSPYQQASIGTSGLDAIRAYVEGGGRYLGICAGGFLASKDTRWEGATYPRPLALFDGSCDGPIVTLATWPNVAPVRLSIEPAGAARGLKAFASTDVLYAGGGRFVGGTETTVLARYPDGSAAAIARRVGKGDVFLIGAHIERPAPAAGGDDAPPPAAVGPALVALLTSKR